MATMPNRTDGVGERYFERPQSHRCPSLLMETKHSGVVHFVDMIPGQDDEVAGVLAEDRIEVLIHGVRGVLIPVFADSLLWQENLDELARLFGDDTPAHPDVPVQGQRLVLGRNEHAAQPGVDAVAQNEIDDAVRSAEVDGRFGAILCEGVKPLARATGEDDGEAVVEEGGHGLTQGNDSMPPGLRPSGHSPAGRLKYCLLKGLTCCNGPPMMNPPNTFSVRVETLMVIARRAVVLGSIVVLFGSAALLAQRAEKGQSDAQRKALQSMLALVDDAAAGRPTPNDFSLAWIHHDLLKVVQQQGQTFVPFIVTLDPAKVAPGPVSVYWRVVSKDAPAAAPPPSTNTKKDDKKAPPPPAYAYESMTPATIGAAQPVRISRSFTTGAGNYDVYVVVREGSPDAGGKKKPDKNAPAPKASVIKQSITVPDLWNGELSTSSVIVAETIEPLPVPPSDQEKASRPYALGGIEIVPYIRTKFTKKEQLNTFILIYNAQTDAEKKPDVKVEFNFFTRQTGGEKFFNKTLPTNLNGQTLSPQDLTVGQLQAGQSVPLASFPEGDYRLEIKVVDNMAKKEVKREVNFSVAGS